MTNITYIWCIDSQLLKSCIHRRRLGEGAARARAPNNRETPVHLTMFTTFCHPNILVCLPNIFDKSTPVLVLILNCLRLF